eukprot:1448268-Rhodomonas_salina.4
MADSEKLGLARVMLCHGARRLSSAATAGSSCSVDSMCQIPARQQHEGTAGGSVAHNTAGLLGAAKLETHV